MSSNLGDLTQSGIRSHTIPTDAATQLITPKFSQKGEVKYYSEKRIKRIKTPAALTLLLFFTPPAVVPTSIYRKVHTGVQKRLDNKHAHHTVHDDDDHYNLLRPSIDSIGVIHVLGEKSNLGGSGDAFL